MILNVYAHGFSSVRNNRVIVGPYRVAQNMVHQAYNLVFQQLAGFERSDLELIGPCLHRHGQQTVPQRIRPQNKARWQRPRVEIENIQRQGNVRCDQFFARMYAINDIHRDQDVTRLSDKVPVFRPRMAAASKVLANRQMRCALVFFTAADVPRAVGERIAQRPN